MRICLINPGKASGESLAYNALTNPLMGLAYVATCLKQNKHDVKVLEMSAYGLDYDAVSQEIVRFKPHVVGITAKTFNILSAYKVADLVKELSSNILVILGGAHPTALVENTFAECRNVDAIIRGEGEETFLSVCNQMKEGSRFDVDFLAEIAGLSFIDKKGNCVYNPDRELIEDLDSLPFPDLALYDLRKFGKTYNPANHRFEREFSVFASRGCPFKCNFCMPLLGRQWRSRSPESIIEEMKGNYRQYGIDHFTFNDSTFGINKQWFHSFCDLLRRSGLHRNITWSFETRADLASSELFEDAVAAGASRVFFGFESGSDDVLSKNGKGLARSDILRAVNIAVQAGMPFIESNFILGLPHETKQSVRETMDLISEIGSLCNIGVNIVSIYPGTELWDMVENGTGGTRWLPGVRMNWSSYDRTTSQIEVNDLTENDILDAYDKAKNMGIKKMRETDALSYGKKAMAYLFYYLQHDRKRLPYYFRLGARELLFKRGERKSHI